MKTPQRRKRPRAEVSASLLRRTLHRADAPADDQRITYRQGAQLEDDRARALSLRLSAPAEAEGSKSGGHQASGGELR